jgi:hypothetical protein
MIILLRHNPQVWTSVWRHSQTKRWCCLLDSESVLISWKQSDCDLNRKPAASYGGLWLIWQENISTTFLSFCCHLLELVHLNYASVPNSCWGISPFLRQKVMNIVLFLECGCTYRNFFATKLTCTNLTHENLEIFEVRIQVLNLLLPDVLFFYP